MQKAGRHHTSDAGSVVHESPSDAALPEMRLDEQGVQLRAAVWARHHSSKASHDAVAFGDEDAARRKLLDRQRDRVGIARSASRSPGFPSDARRCSDSSIDCSSGRAVRMETCRTIGQLRKRR